MIFQFGFYSSLLLITFSQGILYSLLLLRKGIKNGDKSNYWLSGFIFVCSLYVAPWMLGFAGWYDNQPYRDILFYTPFHQLFLFGPLIFFYTQSLLNPNFRLSVKSAWHFLPAVLYLLYSLGMWVYDQLIHHGYYFYADGADKDFDFWYQCCGFISMLVYLVLSIRFYNIYRRFVFQVTSFAESILFKWVKTYLVSFLVLMLLPIAFDLLGLIFPEVKTYTGSWWFFLAFSIVMYYIAITAYSNPVISKIPFRLSFFDSHPVMLLADDQHPETENVIAVEEDSIPVSDNAEIREWKIRIEALMEQQQLFKNPELTLSEVARLLQSNASVISKVVNQGFGQNFNDLINKYRTEAVIKCIADGAHKKSTLLGIAFDCGFNSKATFNRAFKKHTGRSPKDYTAV
ncbi:MAG: AraC family transcriptional regulator [Flavobacterium sp. BFFFF1]|uniref:helix-turn-helix domain-containing protein n=1 Tax=Flavobacterium sp. BFFFF1 TaxID=2015557 RepID=UPI000BD7F6EF|nr:AraC family transcriptional regulator [Flavobacterium sp. BFFFF1]OYU81912.1 MAG: AraC family transcriptional regulator [Flavobacterium sp. BFFFF1]